MLKDIYFPIILQGKTGKFDFLILEEFDPSSWRIRDGGVVEGIAVVDQTDPGKPISVTTLRGAEYDIFVKLEEYLDKNWTPELKGNDDFRLKVYNTPNGKFVHENHKGYCSLVATVPDMERILEFILPNNFQ